MRPHALAEPAGGHEQVEQQERVPVARRPTSWVGLGAGQKQQAPLEVRGGVGVALESGQRGADHQQHRGHQPRLALVGSRARRAPAGRCRAPHRRRRAGTPRGTRGRCRLGISTAPVYPVRPRGVAGQAVPAPVAVAEDREPHPGHSGVRAGVELDGVGVARGPWISRPRPHPGTRGARRRRGSPGWRR